LQHSQRIFESLFDRLDQFHVLCLLPSYMERTGSSLIAMANHFINESKSPHSGFYLNDLDRLVSHLEQLKGDRKVLLLGVSFALLDLAEQYEIDLSHCIVMETGGMKGRRKEITRQELHQIIGKNLKVDRVYSEYGMTELLSQAYSFGNGIFQCPASMRILIREVSDPFGIENHPTGLLNVVDLANAHSCSFVETQDLGRLHHSGHFEVLGRMDNSDVRGCNLMVG
jgi:Acyl-protein synthetase, LuxE